MINLFLIEKYFLIFLLCSFGGWAIETIGELIKSHKFVNRGFLIGPICPIYGVGAILITCCLTRYANDYFVIFGLSAILCGTLEYVTSYLMEKLFKARWWDYSNEKFNINGRICLTTIVLFAIAGILIIDVLNPFCLNILSLINERVMNYICLALAIVFITDFIASLKIMNKIKDISTSISKQMKDNTEEVSTKVKEALLEKSESYRRIIEAFPQAFADRVKQGKEKISETAEKVKANVVEAKDKTAEAVLNVKETTIKKVSELKENISNKYSRHPTLKQEDSKHWSSLTKSYYKKQKYIKHKRQKKEDK